MPMGITLREIIYEIGGGIKGASGSRRYRPADPPWVSDRKHLDTPIDYESLTAAGSMMGSGGMIVLDEDDCMVSVAILPRLHRGESCRKVCPVPYQEQTSLRDPGADL